MPAAVTEQFNRFYSELCRTGHLDYEKVKPDICFKDANTAQLAGFRAPK